MKQKEKIDKIARKEGSEVQLKIYVQVAIKSLKNTHNETYQNRSSSFDHYEVVIQKTK